MYHNACVQNAVQINMNTHCYHLEYFSRQEDIETVLPGDVAHSDQGQSIFIRKTAADDFLSTFEKLVERHSQIHLLSHSTKRRLDENDFDRKKVYSA